MAAWPPFALPGLPPWPPLAAPGELPASIPARGPASLAPPACSLVPHAPRPKPTINRHDKRIVCQSPARAEPRIQVASAEVAVHLRLRTRGKCFDGSIELEVDATELASVEHPPRVGSEARSLGPLHSKTQAGRAHDRQLFEQDFDALGRVVRARRFGDRPGHAALGDRSPHVAEGGA
jgi:hypothetical protein